MINDAKNMDDRERGINSHQAIQVREKSYLGFKFDFSNRSLDCQRNSVPKFNPST